MERTVVNTEVVAITVTPKLRPGLCQHPKSESSHSVYIHLTENAVSTSQADPSDFRNLPNSRAEHSFQVRDLMSKASTICSGQPRCDPPNTKSRSVGKRAVHWAKDALT